MYSPEGGPHAAPPRPPDPHAVRRMLLEHWEGARRALPWRDQRDPYRIWVSEVMLQQTRVETVVPYYLRWLERFPDVESLAAAHRDEVLALWEGLGYYSRALNLHRAAAVVRDRHGGRVPSDPADLARLPGVGPYTAGAVASIAYGAACPAVDGNVRRVLSRLHDLPEPSAADLRELARRLVDPSRPGDFNQALMDLGATVCTPRSPRCGACPLGSVCGARARGTVALRPRPARRARPPERRFGVLVAAQPAGGVLVVRRPEGGLLGGLWAFPEAELEGPWSGDGRGAAEALARALHLKGAGAPLPLPPVRHAFTHFRVLYLPHLLATGARLPDGAGGRWVDPEAPGVAMPAAQKRIALEAAARLAGSRDFPR